LLDLECSSVVKRKVVLLTVSVLYLAHHTGVSARPMNYTEDQLPAYCLHTQAGSVRDPAAIEQYQRVFGDVFHHMHHYCYALFNIQEALRLQDQPTLRATMIRNAIEDFDYVLDRSDSSFVLRPEILVRKGLALLLSKQDIAALACFREAIHLKPDFTPAYVAISNYFLRAGDVEAAKQALESGLKRVPHAAVLQRKLSALGSSPGLEEP
jgi:tetratricopeptide (TPR) repeat protein